MFQFPGFASYHLWIQWKDTHLCEWVSPFGNSWIRACLSASQDLSQITTSFIASDCQGIHRARLVTWPYNPKRSNYGCVFSLHTALQSSLNQSHTWVCSLSRSACALSEEKIHCQIRCLRWLHKNNYLNDCPVKLDRHTLESVSARIY